jgi:hypothetical protein
MRAFRHEQRHRAASEKEAKDVAPREQILIHDHLVEQYSPIDYLFQQHGLPQLTPSADRNMLSPEVDWPLSYSSKRQWRFA